MTASEAVAARKLDPVAAELVERFGFGEEEAERAVDAVLAVVRDGLLAGKQVVLKDLAALRVVERRLAAPANGKAAGEIERLVRLMLVGDFRERVLRAKVATIVLALPRDDSFAKIIEGHFARAGFRVQVAGSTAAALEHVRGGAATALVIVDHALEGAARLVESLRTARATAAVRIVSLFPGAQDPERATELEVRADEHLVEPFEVHALIRLAEGVLARAGEAGGMEQRVRFQLGSTEANLERANDLLARLLAGSDMDAESQELLKAALREAIGNAAQHGNRDDPQKLVRVQYVLDREKVTVVVEDEGPGFDHERYALRAQTKDAVSAARERHEQGSQGGLGIMLMQKCCDRIAYNDVGTAVTLERKLRRS
jgi:anti-sigma regulatory factor (Ser/Thr protein kinase)/nucleoid DNA-binding protein